MWRVMILPFAMTNCSSRFRTSTPTAFKIPSGIQVNSEPVSTISSICPDLSGKAIFSTLHWTLKTPIASSFQHRPVRNRLNNRQIDCQQNQHDDPAHHHKNRRLKRGRQLLQLDLGFGVVERCDLV